jgi:alpha-D-ribose 1-methylphosphonate 5-triphosphate diphosphatase PhnM
VENFLGYIITALVAGGVTLLAAYFATVKGTVRRREFEQMVDAVRDLQKSALLKADHDRICEIQERAREKEMEALNFWLARVERKLDTVINGKKGS